MVFPFCGCTCDKIEVRACIAELSSCLESRELLDIGYWNVVSRGFGTPGEFRLVFDAEAGDRSLSLGITILSCSLPFSLSLLLIISLDECTLGWGWN